MHPADFYCIFSTVLDIGLSMSLEADLHFMISDMRHVSLFKSLMMFSAESNSNVVNLMGDNYVVVVSGENLAAPLLPMGIMDLMCYDREHIEGIAYLVSSAVHQAMSNGILVIMCFSRAMPVNISEVIC